MKNETKIFIGIVAIMVILIISQGEKKEYLGDCDVLNSYRCHSETSRDKCRDWDNDGDLEWNRWNNCATGRICSLGECIEENLICTDSDDGINYNVEGVMYDGLNTYEDSCLSSIDTLYEYYCEEGIGKLIKYICPEGCKTGEGKCTASQTCNTPADLDCNNCIEDSEFPTAVYNWKNQIGGIPDSLFPTVVYQWKTQEGC